MNRSAAVQEPVRVLRVIARLNIGGPAIQVVNLSRRLVPLGYRTVLLRGLEGPREGSMDHLAVDLKVSPVRVPGLQRGVGFHDLRALAHIWRWIRRERPDVLHTHTAKAGVLGRVAAALALERRPSVIVHTFHGHVLKGEFGPRTSRAIALLEHLLARLATRVIAVSEEIRDDLVAFGVAPEEKIEVVRLGFDLDRFTVEGKDRQRSAAAFRRRFGIPDGALVVSVIARVVKVKRIDRFLEMARLVSRRHPSAVFVIAGDGDLREELEQSALGRELGHRLVWAGFQRDVAPVCFASDVVVLTSDNEGTPVCLIEAQAARVPVVTTLVGGVETVVVEGHTGRIVSQSADELAGAVADLLDDEGLRQKYGRSGREHVLASFTVDRLVADIDLLYRRLLSERRAPAIERLSAGTA